tara:strand:- start:1554 stop:2537 length:984 start_codon:yes stop_codon:yes gene_type:complete
MPKAVLCKAFGDPETLVVEEVPTQEPGPGEVAVAIEAAGVNFADTLIIQGKYQEKPPFPFTPGMEAAGTVTALGSGVTGLEVGQKVIAMVIGGAFKQQGVALASDVHPLPAGMDFVVGASFPVTYGTAHAGLVWHANLQPGEILMVHGAAGGVGLAAVEVGKALGARVIATAGGPEKLAVAKAHGADDLIDYKTEDIRARVKELTGGKGVNVVFDPVGGDVFDASLRSIAWGGRLIVVGFAAGRVQQIPANILLVKNIAAMGVYWGSYRKQAPERLAEEFAQLNAWFEAGKLKPHVSHQLPLAGVDKAIRLLMTRKATGKVVIETNR